jgi:hypothetical protein
MKKGYELLKSNRSAEKIDFSDFEKKNGLTLPESFKRFADHIQLGADEYHIAEFNLEKVYDDSSQFILALGWIEREVANEAMDKIIFDRFVANDKLIVEWQNALQSDNLTAKYGLLPIGYLFEPVHVRVFLSARSEDSGAIYMDTNEEMKTHHEADIIKISDSIWSFIEGCEERISSEVLMKFKSESLIKKWGEDFWRVSRL